MAEQLLGTRFDIHGGGMDLKFPHHENEIAQSCAASGDEFANVWMHNGFVNIDNEKMSKSLGNFFTMREVLPKVRDPEVLRYFLLSSHYRGPDQLLAGSARAGGCRAQSHLYGIARLSRCRSIRRPARTARAFSEVMDDDFNTPEALAVLQTLTREINTARDAGKNQKTGALAGELRTLARVLGLAQLEPSDWFRRVVSKPTTTPGLSDAEAQQLVDARAAARVAKNWAESDRLRDELAAGGVIVEDKPGGRSTWRRT